MRIAAILIVAAMVAAPVGAGRSKESGEAQLAKMLKGYVPAKQVHCVNLSDITNQTIVDRTAIVYWGMGGKAWVNRPDGAEFLREDNILISKPFGGQSCRHDIIHQRDQMSHIPGGAIGLNDFTLYTKVKPR